MKSIIGPLAFVVAVVGSIAVGSVALATFQNAPFTNAGPGASITTSGGTLSGHLLFSPDTTYDIGASGATRPRHVYVADEVRAGTALALDGSANSASFGTAKDFNWNSWGLTEANNAGALNLSSGSTLQWSSTSAYTGSKDLQFSRSAAGIAYLQNPGGTTGAVLQFLEMTAPANSAANQARLFAEDTGGGKTRLCAIFSSGAKQCFATEP